MFLKVRANDFIRTMLMFCCQASAKMVRVMALLNVSQYTRMVSMTPNYIYMMIELVFISIHYLEMMIINSLAQYIAQFEFAMPRMKESDDGLNKAKQNNILPQSNPSLLIHLLQPLMQFITNS